MTSTPPNEPLEAFPIPDGAIVLAPSDQQLTPRASVIQALQQAMSERRFTLPLGPESALLDHNRLVSLNHFAVQLNLAGLMADEISIDLSPWREDQNAPQLSMAALVDSENDVVVVQGVLTNEEMQELVKGNDLSAEDLTLGTDCFKGGLDRLFTLVQLLEPSAIPRRALSTSLQRLLSSVILIGDWIQGQVDDTLTAYGARLQPITAGAFRAGVPDDLPSQSQALLSIPLGLDAGNQLVNGDAALICVERFKLLLIPTGSDLQPDALVVRLCGDVANDLLPDGLVLQSKQGKAEQNLTSFNDLQLELSIDNRTELIELKLRFEDSVPLELPPLQLP